MTNKKKTNQDDDLGLSKRELARYKAAAARVEPKTQRAFLDACAAGTDRKVAARDLKISETAMWGILFWPPRPPSVRELARKEAMALPRKTRQEFLDRFWAENSTYVEIQKAMGLSDLAALGILAAATKTVKVLGRVAK